jgi:hypothetical protein
MSESFEGKEEVLGEPGGDIAEGAMMLMQMETLTYADEKRKMQDLR